MKQKFKMRFLSALTAVATVGTIFLSATSVKAVSPTNMSDTLTREKVSTLSTHTIRGTFTGATWSFTTSLYINYDHGTFDLGWNLSAGCSLSTGDACIAIVDGDTDMVSVRCNEAAGCSGDLTITNVTGTNPTTEGSYKIEITNGEGDPTTGYSGDFAIPIVDDDQVTVTATVDPSITFDLDVGVASSSNEVPTDFVAYTVPLGTLTVSGVNSSGPAESINSIWVDLGTNANSGAVVTVTSTNGGLKSTSVGTDIIQALGGAMATGTENYGLCAYVIGFTQDSGGPMDSVSPFNGAVCAPDGDANAVGAFDTNTAMEILNSTNLPVNAGRAQIIVNAAISAATPAHNDYTDTLTFIATGTF